MAFLDEPTAGVDPEGRLAIRAVVADLRAQGVCVLLTTHELAEAEKMADRIVILSSGRVVLDRDAARADRGGAGSTGLTFGAPAGLDTVALAAALGPGVSVHGDRAGSLPDRGGVGPGRHRHPGHLAGGARDATLTDLVTGRTLEDVYFEAVGAAALQQTESSTDSDDGERGTAPPGPWSPRRPTPGVAGVA